MYCVYMYIYIYICIHITGYSVDAAKRRVEQMGYAGSGKGQMGSTLMGSLQMPCFC